MQWWRHVLDGSEWPVARRRDGLDGCWEVHDCRRPGRRARRDRGQLRLDDVRAAQPCRRLVRRRRACRGSASGRLGFAVSCCRAAAAKRSELHPGSGRPRTASTGVGRLGNEVQLFVRSRRVRLLRRRDPSTPSRGSTARDPWLVGWSRQRVGSGIGGLSDPRFEDGEIAHRVAVVLAFLLHHDAQAPPDRAGLIGIARRGG